MQGCKILIGLVLPVLLVGQTPTVSQNKNSAKLNATGVMLQLGKLISKTENSINVSSLANGLYHISCLSNNDAVFLNEKVVIIK